MCGIVALFTPKVDQDRPRAILSTITRAIKHRGPDHQGEWWDDTVPLGLAQRRLSIIDLSPDGHQPMISATGRYVITFNGEIYNFQTLRNDLEERGVTFRGRSDTEVLLAAIEADGLNAACQKISGMYAIVLYDRQKQTLHLIRDPLGKKPLYFGWAGDHFICGSELRVFMAHPEFKRHISAPALAAYLHFGFIPAPFSLFADVSMLTPGCHVALPLAELKPNVDIRARMDPFWSPARKIEEARAAAPALASMTEAQRIARTENVIEDAVKRRMIADVPLGAFLSGGIDSSLVTALMQKNSDRAVKTYSIGFSEQGYDESIAAERIAAHLGTDHHTQIFGTDDALSIIDDLPHLCDEPMADVSFLPTYVVSRFARQDVTVALSGDGGDELFGGYYRHTHMQRILRGMMILPHAFRPALGSILKLSSGLLAHHPQQAARYRKLVGLLNMGNLPDAYEFLVGMAEENAITHLSTPLAGYPFRTSSHWPTNLTIPEWMMFADTVHYLPNNVLTKVDRATMAVSLEARAPLLDPQVFLHAWALPLHDKIRHGTGKYMLRRVLERHVPTALFEREKQGFAVPIGDWIKGPLRARVESVLFSGRLSAQLGIDEHAIRAIWDGHQTGVAPAPQTLWRLYVLGRWVQAYL